jgi:NADH:ubiquinone oxidoreductase subunit 6 (subunit J)
MLTTNIDKIREERTEFGQLFFGVIGACAMVTLLLTAIWNVKQWAPRTPQNPSGVVLATVPEGTNTTSIIGELFMGDFALLFIASSIAILVALVGAAMIARNDKMTPEEAAERM